MESANVVLLSGGVDSVTLVHDLAAGGVPIQALFLDYGQRDARLERVASEYHCDPQGVELIALDLASLGEPFRNVQARKANIPLPHRNLVVLSVGLSFVANLGARRLYLSLTREDTLPTSCSSHAFLAQFRLLSGLLGDVQLATPFVDMSKADVIRRGESWALIMRRPTAAWWVSRCTAVAAANALVGARHSAKRVSKNRATSIVSSERS